LPPFLERIKTWRNGSGTFRMNVALSALPSFTALPGDGDHLTAGIILAPSLDYMDRAWLDARHRAHPGVAMPMSFTVIGGR